MRVIYNQYSLCCRVQSAGSEALINDLAKNVTKLANNSYQLSIFYVRASVYL
jgi:hypothetical protein